MHSFGCQVRKDVLEKDCVEMLESMIDWLKRRAGHLDFRFTLRVLPKQATHNPKFSG